ncbi:hypothetical protein [Mesorhizobium sp.]|uniref:hypothetical protein n=1 Tax=Mesorhizobium sp. TaxID=1871066 RepID=UPI000FE79327|nr:hypothetical protein [Mesorhizobium sp.]RWK57082.1 MAG: hypothetical protein EOR49_34185 [Mesorhizobium sp.]RWM45046.1 MAG: hypothetical protein EOR76_22040 [Mesorhizobium sp.]RWM53189.1 MAG: hypothetical protein EOR78_20160 [Mesorhizobium sp.]RWN00163.1 MAG: hypothetical protein EOR85_16535 [Mesorhizobium sp.]TIO64916.1 MAG: hypothetical protein E5X85_30930 [Mesorhizobium sp.]
MAEDPIIQVLQQNVPQFDGPEPAESVTRPDPDGINLGLSRVVPGATGFTRFPAQYEGASRAALMHSALKQPLSLFSTLTESAKKEALQSYGLGTLLREAQLPEEAPTVPGITADPGERDFLKSRRETPQELGARRQSMGAYDEDQYKASPYFRKDIPYDPGMTEARAAALADMDDARKVREHYASKRPLAAFIGGMGGQALDPINYIPVAGPLVKAAAVAKAGKIAGGALHAGLDAAANTAVFGIATAGQRAKFGDDVSWQSTVSQIATAALIGSAFGAIGGVVGRRVDARVMSEAESRLATLKTTQEARIALNEGIDAIVRGEDIKLSPNATGPISRVAADVAKNSAFTPEPAPVTKSATISDVAESLRVVKEQHPELDPVTSPSKFDALLIADLQAKGFDGVDSQAPAGPVPLNFDPATVDVPEMVIGPNGRPIEAALNPTSPAYGRMLIAEAEARLPELQQRLAKLNRPHNRLRAKLEQNSFLSGIADPLGTIERSRNLPELVSYYEGQKARGEAIVAGKVDTTQATPEPLPDGLAEAQARIAKADTPRDLAEQYGVDLATGNFAEMADIEQLRSMGRLTAEDEAALADAAVAFDTAEAYGNAMKAALVCLV